MERVREFVVNYLKDNHDVDDYDIDNSLLGYFMDSLSIVDLVVEIEKEFEIDVYDDWSSWEDNKVNDVVKYIENKLIEKYGE